MCVENTFFLNKEFIWTRVLNSWEPALRGSPPYFEKAKKDLFAMIRQLCPATLFYSFSSAETQWIHLLKILGKRLDSKDYCDSELFNQPLYFCVAYPKLSNWQDSCYLNQTTVLSLPHPNLPCIYSQKIFLPLIYSSASSQKNLLLASTCTPWVAIFRFACETEDFEIWNLCSVHFRRKHLMR